MSHGREELFLPEDKIVHNSWRAGSKPAPTIRTKYLTMNYQIVEKLPSPEEYTLLRQTVGWGIHDHDVIVKALPNSLYCVCAYANADIIGMARIIGDGGLAYYIQDVIG